MKERSRSPGPQEYEPQEVVYQIRGPSNAIFGTQAERDQLIQRDVSRSPFKQPTFVENPSPAVYETQSKMSKTSFLGGLGYASGANSNAGIDPTTQLKEQFSPEKKSNSVFHSLQPRDNLASVSKDCIKSPGPGAYI